MKKKKQPGAEAVLARARQMVRQEKRKLWTTLGFEGEFSEAEFDAKVGALAAQKAQSPAEGAGGGDKALAAENVKLKARLVAAQRERRKVWAALKLGDEYDDAKFGEKLLEYAKQASALRKEVEGKARELEDFKIEHQIKEAARASGFVDPDYGTDLYRRHVAGLKEDAEPPAVEAFFEELRKDAKRKHLFEPARVPAGPRPAGADTKGKDETDNQPGEGRAAPPASSTNGDADVSKMSGRDFARYRRETYGFAPGS